LKGLYFSKYSRSEFAYITGLVLLLHRQVYCGKLAIPRKNRYDQHCAATNYFSLPFFKYASYWKMFRTTYVLCLVQILLDEWVWMKLRSLIWVLCVPNDLRLVLSTNFYWMNGFEWNYEVWFEFCVFRTTYVLCLVQICVGWMGLNKITKFDWVLCKGVRKRRDARRLKFYYARRFYKGVSLFRIEVTGRRGRRCRKLLDDLKERREYSHLKEEALNRTMWRARFERGFGPVVRQTTKWTNEVYWHGCLPPASSK